MSSDWEATLETVRQRQSLSTRWILATGCGAAIFLAASLGGLWVFYAAEGQRPVAPSATQFPQPALQDEPGADLRKLIATQIERLHRYAWSDSAGGVVQVPIERAMQIVAGRGDKAYDPP